MSNQTNNLNSQMNNPFNGYYYYPTNNEPTKEVKPDMDKLRSIEADKVVPKKSGMSWSSIIIKPNLVFQTQNPNERVYVLVRAHWITNIGWLSRNFFIGLLPFEVYFVLSLFNITIDLSFINIKLVVILALLYYSFIFTSLVSNFIDWYFDPFIVTDQRIIDFDYKPYSNYSVSEVALQDIQEVKERSSGFIGDIFNYGNVFVLSANDNTKMICGNVPSPTKVRDIITDLSKIAKTFKNENI